MKLADKSALSIAQLLIPARTVNNTEATAARIIEGLCEIWDWPLTRIPVTPERWNILIKFGEPHVILTTHIDVVPATDELFVPIVRDGALWGRGACDALGLVAAMIEAAHRLITERVTNFALLFVVGEEDDGIGALTAAKFLADAPVKYLIDGEPTDRKLITAHKGGLDFEIECRGKAAHSGYPEAGVDANLLLLSILDRLQHMDLGQHPVLGSGTLNIGMINAGVAGNVISPHATARCLMRTVESTQVLQRRVIKTIGTAGTVEFSYTVDPVELHTVPGFETAVASFCTDVPQFAALKNTKKLLYGPGSILVAHTVEEHVNLAELEAGVADYTRLVKVLLKQI